MSKTLHPQTLAIRGGKEQTQYREHNQALFLTSSFMFESAQQGAALFAKEIKGFTYTRTANPTIAAFEQRISALEGAERSVATSTGMSAIQASFSPSSKQATMSSPAAACSVRPRALSITS